jgi:hypothetical protein
MKCFGKEFKKENKNKDGLFQFQSQGKEFWNTGNF